ncbi:MAG: NUDIX domain-containing protein [Deltaproteobacteria bacterium]|jgi:predicted NUDIX family NTP pyrophosphohydrolase|nr:MAG: NUDIX domain-containing protein [Deltaproteobacteria bacterium]
MMAHKKTAGLLLYRIRDSAVEVFLVHPGGPFWAKKDEGAWSIPKGEFADDEQPLSAATREFQEETGFSMEGNFMALAPLKQRSGKLVYAWALEGDCDAGAIKSNLFSMEWPPRSGKRQEYPEVDRASWFTLESAKRRIVPGQIAFLEELQQMLDSDAPTS